MAPYRFFTPQNGLPPLLRPHEYRADAHFDRRRAQGYNGGGAPARNEMRA